MKIRSFGVCRGNGEGSLGGLVPGMLGQGLLTARELFLCLELWVSEVCILAHLEANVPPRVRRWSLPDPDQSLSDRRGLRPALLPPGQPAFPWYRWAN